MELTTAIKSMGVAKKIADKSFDIYKQIKTNRLNLFALNVELRYEYMTEKEKSDLNKFIDSEEGNCILVDFIDTVVNIQNKIVMMALALLYCQDSDFNFNATEKMIFLRASKDLDNEIVDFYLKAYSQSNSDNEKMAYYRKVIYREDLKEFNNIGEDLVSFYINSLINMGLLLPDPQAQAVFAGSEGIWYVPYGTNSTTDKFRALLIKAEALLKRS